MTAKNEISNLHDSTPLEIVLRLDDPISYGTYLVETIPLKGWIFLPESFVESEAAIDVEVLCELSKERDPALYIGMRLTGEILRVGIPSRSGIELTKFNIGERRRVRAGSGFALSGTRFSFSGELSVRELLKNGKEFNRILLCVVCRRESAVAISNEVDFYLPEKNSWSKPRAGLFHPVNGALVVSDGLYFEGWAGRVSDRVKEVQFLLNGKAVGHTRSSLQFPSVKVALQGSEQLQKCRLCGIASATEIAREFSIEAESAQAAPFRVEMRVDFESGETISAYCGEIRFLNSGDADRWGTGAIERIAVAENGAVEIGGWILLPPGAEKRVFIEGRAFRVEIVENGEHPPRISWEEQPRIDERFPLASNNRSGFLVQIMPGALDKSPGLVRLVFDCGGERYQIGSDGNRAEITQLLTAEMTTDGRSTVKQRLAQIVGEAGIRKEFNAVTCPLLEQSADRALLVATHNLSAVEGAPKVLLSVMKALVAAGVSGKEILLVSPLDGPLRGDFQALGIKVEVVSEISVINQSWGRYHRGLELVAGLVKQHLGDLFGAGKGGLKVLANTLDTFWSVDFAQRVGVESTWSVHESVDPISAYPELDSKLRQIFVSALRRSQTMLFVAEATKELFTLVVGGEIEVIPNGIDISAIRKVCGGFKTPGERRDWGTEIRRALDIDEDVEVISILGTTTHRKGQDTFIRGMAELKKREVESKFCFLVVGAREGDYLNSLRELAASVGLSDCLRFIPETRDVAQYYMVSDVLVIASREESAPLVSLEAYAFGVPLVTTAVFGLHEQIIPNETALVFDPDDVSGLASAIQQLLQHPELKQSIAENGSKLVESKFSSETCLNRYVDRLTTTA